MKVNSLTIKIHKPAKDVFEFVTNPKNSPKWENFVASAEASEWPPKLGTIYSDKDAEGDVYEYEVTAFEQGKVFELSQDWGFHVRYTITSPGDKTTEFEYREWVDKGELDELVPQAMLEKLKKAVEAAK